MSIGLLIKIAIMGTMIWQGTNAMKNESIAGVIFWMWFLTLYWLENFILITN